MIEKHDTKQPQCVHMGAMIPSFKEEQKKPVLLRMPPYELFHMDCGFYLCGRCDRPHAVGYQFAICLN